MMVIAALSCFYIGEVSRLRSGLTCLCRLVQCTANRTDPNLSCRLKTRQAFLCSETADCFTDILENDCRQLVRLI